MFILADEEDKSKEKSDSDDKTKPIERNPSPGRQSKPPREALSDQEEHWRCYAYDYAMRFCGHCNTTTDIKEANFFGRYATKSCYQDSEYFKINSGNDK